MMRFNIGVEITDAPAMRALALQRHLAQGYSEADFIAARPSSGRTSPRPIG